MAEAEATLGRKRKAQRWAAERRRRGDVEVAAARADVDKASELEAKVLQEVQQAANARQVGAAPATPGAGVGEAGPALAAARVRGRSGAPREVQRAAIAPIGSERSRRPAHGFRTRGPDQRE